MKHDRQRTLQLRRATNVQFLLRALPALSVFICYFVDRKALDFYGSGRFSGDFLKSPVLVFVWIFLLIDLLSRLFPLPFRSIGMKKAFACSYKPRIEGNKPDRRTIAKLQRNALRSFLFYLFFNALYGLPYLLIVFGVWTPGQSGVLPEKVAAFLQNVGAPELLFGAMLYYLMDFVFTRFWCIFRNVLNKNRCCADCRINCWDGFMCMTPLAFCPLSFFSASVLFAALLSFGQFEIAFYRRPERFDEKCNAALSCAECKNDVCPRKMKGKKR
jgi:hypothetical protein